MSSLELPGRSEPWLTAAATLAGYGLIVTVMFILLFVLPYFVFPA